MAADISYEEWLAELARLGETEPAAGAGLTARQIAARMGWTVEKVRRYLQLADEQGRLVRHKINERNIAGLMAPKTAYTVLPEKPAAKGKKK